MEMDYTIYKLLLWAVPVMLGILGFIGALAVKSLMKLSNDVGEIKVDIREIAVKHEDLEDRIVRIENKVFT